MVKPLIDYMFVTDRLVQDRNLDDVDDSNVLWSLCNFLPKLLLV